MNGRNKLLIIGASGHGRVVADIAMKMNKWQEITFLDDNENIQSPIRVKVIGKSNDAFAHINDYDIFVAIGNNKTREGIQTRLEMAGASIPTLIHPSAIIGEKVEVGIGTVVMAGVVINCCSTIGEGCIINTGSVIDHDNAIEDYVHISPGVITAGNVNIGKGTWLGIGSVVSNNVGICNNAVIGAGAVVVDNICQGGVFVGVPAKRILS